MAATRLVPELVACLDVKDDQYDGVVVVTDCINKLTGNLQCLKAPCEQYREIDSSFGKQVTLIPVPELPSRRLFFAPTGSLNRDCDDVRKFGEAATKGIKRALEAGCRRPLLVRPIDDSFPKAGQTATLGALHALYVPLEIREDVPSRAQKVEKLGIWCDDLDRVTKGIKTAVALESGRIVARDIGGSDPERMAPPAAAKYVEDTFKDTCVKVQEISGQATFEKHYPLLAAVNRSAAGISRHDGRLLILEYEGDGPIDQTILLVGKGITYDTGGADIKAGGIMAGMHRDKCGAAAVAGFFQTLSLLKPKGLKVIGSMSMVRNSVGSDCYVSDEIITSRAGVRIRVGNTDAEGRMVMADLLCYMKERALTEVNPQIFTVATLTGHVIRCYGDKYTATMDNGPSLRQKTSLLLQEAGESCGDPFEMSTIRREDYAFVQGPSEYEDVLQCNNQGSSSTARGHQFPAAFMIRAAKMDEHGIDSQQPIPYTHLDVAGSSGPFPGIPTGAPILALATRYVLDRV